MFNSILLHWNKSFDSIKVFNWELKLLAYIGAWFWSETLLKDSDSWSDVKDKEKEKEELSCKIGNELSCLKKTIDHTPIDNSETISDTQREDINEFSLNKLLAGKNFDDLKMLLNKLNRVEPILSSSKWDIVFTLFNTWPIKDLLAEAWYEPDWFFWPFEVRQVYETIRDMVKTQESVSGLNYKELSSILFDFNRDKKIDTTEHLYVWEAQIYHEIKNEVQFLTFLRNLWVIRDDDALDKVKEKMWTNLTKFRMSVQNGLFRLIAAWVNPPVLLRKDWISKFVKKQFEIQDEVLKDLTNKPDSLVLEQISSAVLNSPELEKVLSEVPEKYRIATKETVRLTAIWFAMWPNWPWVWANFQVNDFIKSIWVWLAPWWIPVVTTTIAEWEKFWVNASIWTIYVIPFVTLTWELFKPKPDDVELKNSFTEMNTRFSVSPYVWSTIPPFLITLWAWFNILDEDTNKWIESMVKTMWDKLDKIKSWVIGSKKFNDIKSSLSLNDATNENLDWFETIFNEFDRYYKMFWSSDAEKKLAERFMTSLKDWYLIHYNNQLFKKASEGIHLSQIWAWVVLLAWFLPIPFVSAAFESKEQKVIPNWSKWSAAAREVTKEKMEEGQIKERWIEKRWNIIKIPSIQPKAISIEKWATWVKIQFADNAAYIDQNSLQQKSITISKHSTSKWTVDYLVIWNWLTTDSGEMILSKEWEWEWEYEINSWLKGSFDGSSPEWPKTVTKTEPDKTEPIKPFIENVNVVSSLKGVADVFYQYIDKWAYFNIPEFQSFINEVANYKRGTEWAKNLTLLWNYLDSLLSVNTKLSIYLYRKLRTSSYSPQDYLDDIRANLWLNSTPQWIWRFDLNNEHKEHILTVLLDAVMKDGNLAWRIWQPGESLDSAKSRLNYQWAQTIANYENTKWKSRFSRKERLNNWLKEEFWNNNGALNAEIDRAQAEIDGKLWDKKIIITKFSEDPSFIAFPCQMLWDNIVIIPRSWPRSVEIADVDWDWKVDNDLIKLNNISHLPAAAIDHFPESVLNELAEKIKSHLPSADRSKCDTDVVRSLLKWENVAGLNWVRLTYDVVFFKWWRCFNSSIWIKNINIVVPWATSSTTIQPTLPDVHLSASAETYWAVNETTNLWVALYWEARKKDNSAPPAPPPWEEKNEQPKSWTDPSAEPANPNQPPSPSVSPPVWAPPSGSSLWSVWTSVSS